MTEIELNISLRLSCQRALLGTITPNIRMITIKCNGLKELYFRAYYDSPLSDDDVNEMEAAVAEIVADLPFEKDHGAECIYDTRPKNELEHYKWIVYSRKE